jgi:hypothetical protein
MTISLSSLLKVRNVLDKRCSENQNTHFMFSNCFPKIVPLEIMSKNMVEPEWPHTVTWRRVACWISKATQASICPLLCTRPPTLTRTHTHTQKFVILIDFPRQQWFENAPQLYVIGALPVLSTLQRIQTGCLTHQDSCFISTVSTLLGIMRPECQADHVPRTNAKFKNWWSYKSSHPYPFMTRTGPHLPLIFSNLSTPHTSSLRSTSKHIIQRNTIP